MEYCASPIDVKGNCYLTLDVIRFRGGFWWLKREREEKEDRRF